MTENSLLLRNARLVNAEGEIVTGGLLASEGEIRAVFTGEPPAVSGELEELDAEGRHVLPGVIDPHVQLYPRPDFAHYATETGSAAIGGVTTILKMHRDLDGYDATSYFDEITAAETRAYIDFAFHLAVMTEAQIAAIPEYSRAFDLTSFKLFMAYKGEEGYAIGIQGVDDGLLLEAFAAIASVGGVALVHCENQELASRARGRVESEGGNGLRAWAESRPSVVEGEAVRRAAYLARVTQCPLYVVHVTSRDALEYLVAERRSSGQQLFIETESHYITDTCDSPAGVLAKVIPPIREETDRAALWNGLETGEINAIGSDHVSASRARKTESVWDAQLGFPGIATILPVLLSEGVAGDRLSLSRVVQLTSAGPARIFGLRRKGALRPGMDADFVIVDLDLERKVDAAMLGSESDFSIYEGRTFRGWPITTVCRGEIIVRDGALLDCEGHGRYLRRSPRVEVTA